MGAVRDDAMMGPLLHGRHERARQVHIDDSLRLALARLADKHFSYS
jgi:hypothetical protein